MTREVDVAPQTQISKGVEVVATEVTGMASGQETLPVDFNLKNAEKGEVGYGRSADGESAAEFDVAAQTQVGVEREATSTKVTGMAPGQETPANDRNLDSDSENGEVGADGEPDGDVDSAAETQIGVRGQMTATEVTGTAPGQEILADDYNWKKCRKRRSWLRPICIWRARWRS